MVAAAVSPTKDFQGHRDRHSRVMSRFNEHRTRLDARTFRYIRNRGDIVYKRLRWANHSLLGSNLQVRELQSGLLGQALVLTS